MISKTLLNKFNLYDSKSEGSFKFSLTWIFKIENLYHSRMNFYLHSLSCEIFPDFSWKKLLSSVLRKSINQIENYFDFKCTQTLNGLYSFQLTLKFENFTFPSFSCRSTLLFYFFFCFKDYKVTNRLFVDGYFFSSR